MLYDKMQHRLISCICWQALILQPLKAAGAEFSSGSDTKCRCLKFEGGAPADPNSEVKHEQNTIKAMGGTEAVFQGPILNLV